MTQLEAQRKPALATAAFFFAAISILSACAREDSRLKQPELACQFMKCVCEEPDPEVLDTPERVAVLWAENGDAYCPEGFELRNANPKDSEFVIQHGG